MPKKFLYYFFSYLDTNECEQNACGIPAESCTNTNGNYTCTCEAGYTVLATSSGHACLGSIFDFSSIQFFYLGKQKKAPDAKK